MKPTENDIALVEKYFDAELSDEEMKIFTNRVEHDQEFKSLVHREKIIIGAIRNQGLVDTLDYLKSVEEKIEGNQSSPSRPMINTWVYYAAAAVVALLVVVIVLLPSRQNTDELFTSYFTAYPNVFEPTVRGAATATDRTAAFQAYEQKDYQQASTRFKNLLAEKKEPEVLLLLGNSNLMLGNVEEAEQNFITLIRDFDDLDLQAKWYLSLSYLKSGELENARKVLEELGSTDISYASKAKELLEKVD